MFGFMKPVPRSTPREAWQAVQEGALLIDVRERFEWRRGHARGARHIPLGRIAAEAEALPRDRAVHVICASGNRSRTAARRLSKAGLGEVYSVAGGTAAWLRAGLPAEDF